MSQSIARTAIIGTGGIARAHMRAMAEETKRVEVVAAVDIDEERVNAFTQEHGIPNAYTDAAAMLASEQPDLVHIATPPSIHADLAVLAMEAGAWVLCEKPLCASLAEMDRIEAAEATSGNYCSSVFQWRFGSGGQHLKRLIDAGELGRPMVANILTTWYRTPEYYAVPWRGKWETELGGCSMGHGIHAMDFLLYQFGEWQEVRAMIGTLDRDIDVEDVSMVMVRFANGAMANITNSVLSPRQESYLRFDFQRATAELTHLYSYDNEHWRYTAVDEFEDQQATWQAMPPNRHSTHGAQLTALLNSMERSERPLVSGPAARGTIEFLASLYKSAMTGEPVTRGSIKPGDPFYEQMCGPCDQAWQRS